MKPVAQMISSVHRAFKKNNNFSQSTEKKTSSELAKDELNSGPRLTPTLAVQNRASLPAPYRKGLVSSIERIRSLPPGDLRLYDISKALFNPDVDVEGKVWLGICQRLEGRDGTAFLKPYIDHPGFGRLALVNLAATYACLPSLGPGGRDLEAETKACLIKIREHLASFPNDKFSRLLESLLTYRLYNHQEALRLVESLYLVDKNYSPAISTMAAYLHFNGLFAAARDYAGEALTVDKDNFQAQAILYAENMPPFSREIEAKLCNVSFKVYAFEPISILFSKYSGVDDVL
jgi:hypothetical protein